MAGKEWVCKMWEESQDFIVTVLRMKLTYTDLCVCVYIYIYNKLMYSKLSIPLHEYGIGCVGCMRKTSTEI
jgi:hypothetical protein